jgi:hypothetical protein
MQQLASPQVVPRALADPQALADLLGSLVVAAPPALVADRLRNINETYDNYVQTTLVYFLAAPEEGIAASCNRHSNCAMSSIRIAAGERKHMGRSKLKSKVCKRASRKSDTLLRSMVV